MMPFVNVFVDEFHVQKSMYGICPYIDPAVHQDKISEESYPTMIVHVIVHLEKISSVEMTHENRCSDKSSQKRIHERPLHCFGVKFGRELAFGLTLPILRVVLLKYLRVFASFVSERGESKKKHHDVRCKHVLDGMHQSSTNMK